MKDNRPRSPGATRFAERHATLGAVPPWVHDQGHPSAIITENQVVKTENRSTVDDNGGLPLGMVSSQNP